MVFNTKTMQSIFTRVLVDFGFLYQNMLLLLEFLSTSEPKYTWILFIPLSLVTFEAFSALEIRNIFCLLDHFSSCLLKVFFCP